jgi:hypothetical protein
MRKTLLAGFFVFSRDVLGTRVQGVIEGRKLKVTAKW